MSADLLRRAAALMRERAEVATEYRDAHTQAPLPWHANAGSVYDSGAAPIAATADAPKGLHIASWNPVVALAVADLLTRVADDYAIASHGYWSTVAENVARAYLGESA